MSKKKVGDVYHCHNCGQNIPKIGGGFTHNCTGKSEHGKKTAPKKGTGSG